MFVPARRAIGGTDQGPPRRIISITGGEANGLSPCITSKYRLTEAQLYAYKKRSCDEAEVRQTYLAKKQDTAVLQGMARNSLCSDARKCATSCSGCTLISGASRGYPGDLQRGNICNPGQAYFNLSRLVGSVSRCKARRKELEKMRMARKAAYHANLTKTHALNVIRQASDWSNSVLTKIRSFAESANERSPGPTAYPKLSKSSRPVFASFQEGSDSSNAPLQSMERNFPASRAPPTRRVSLTSD